MTLPIHQQVGRFEIPMYQIVRGVPTLLGKTADSASAVAP